MYICIEMYVCVHIYIYIYIYIYICAQAGGNPFLRKRLKACTPPPPPPIMRCMRPGNFTKRF